MNNEGITSPEGLQKQASHWKTSLFQDKENEGKVDSLLTNKGNLPKSDVNKGEKTEISDEPSIVNSASEVDHVVDIHLESKPIDCQKFTVPEKTSVEFQGDVWGQLYSKCTLNEGKTKMLPSHWTKVFSDALIATFPYCCVNFKRHKLFKNDSNLVKVWYYCKIEGCVLNGTATLDKSFSLTIFNKQTELKHEKGKQKSFESRNSKYLEISGGGGGGGADRKHLGEKVADMAFPSKYFHRKLASLDEK